MLWKVLVPLCLLSLSGFAYGDEDFDFVGKRKLMSVEAENTTESQELVTENNNVEEKVEDQPQSVEEALVTEKEKRKEKEKKKDKKKGQERKEKKKEEEKEKEAEEEKGEEKKKREMVEVEERENTPEIDIPENDELNLDDPSLIKRKDIHWHLQRTYLHLYTRNQPEQIVPAHKWFTNFVPDRDLVILVHGASSSRNYITDFFTTLSNALLNESHYNVIGVDWRRHVVPETKEGHLAANVHIGTLLGQSLYYLFKKHLPGFFKNTLNTYYIGHDIGTIPPITLAETYKKPIQYVYGLDPSIQLTQSKYRLAQEHGDVVAILSTNDYPYSYGHKNVYAVPNKDKLPHVYKILATAISQGSRTATFCSSAEDFKQGYCKKLPEVPIWFTHAHTTDRTYPVGRYYFYEPSLVNKNYC